MRLKIGVFLALFLLVGQGFYFYDVLPFRLASRFDWDGSPLLWRTKESFYILWSFTVLLVTGSVFWVSRYVLKMPKSQLNVPNRDYWLHPEREQKTRETLREFCELLLLMLLAFLNAIFYLNVRANLGEPEQLSKGPFYAALVLFLLATFSLLCRYYHRFKNRS